MRGDRVEIVIDAGDVTKTYEVAATRAGRRVEVVTRRGQVEVSELTRGGTPVRTARFIATGSLSVIRSRCSGRPGLCTGAYATGIFRNIGRAIETCFTGVNNSVSASGTLSKIGGMPKQA